MKIFLAGAEAILTYLRMCPDLIPFLGQGSVLMTYYSKDNTDKMLRTIAPQTGLTMVDSGAHSFFSQHIPKSSAGGHTAQKDKRTEDPDRYVKQYIDWVVQNYDKFDFFVELDIQEIVGIAKVNEWRQAYRDAGIIDKIIPVWHYLPNNWKDWEEWCDEWESRYIGIEGPRGDRGILPYNRFLKHAYDRQCKVHGFGLVQQEILWKCPFYSVDSTLWKMAVMYGSVLKYDELNHKLIYIQHPKKLMQSKGYTLQDVKTFYKQHHENLFYATQTDEAKARGLLTSGQAIQTMAEHYTKIWGGRGISWEEPMNG